MEKNPRRVTSTDVARASGVSQATVSYVLNNDPRQSIALETRERVLKTAATLGYRPSTSARDLRAGYSTVVLAVIQFAQVDPGIARALKMLETRLTTHGLSLLWYVGVDSSSSTDHPSRHLTPAAIVSAADGSEPEIAAYLRQFNVPVVSLLNNSSRHAVGKMQVEYLFRAGKRSLVYAAPERQDLQQLAQARLEGVRQGCEEFGLEAPCVQVIPSSREGAREAIAALVDKRSLPLGICCYNDEIAFAVLAALTDIGISIPESVAVIGCDDIPLSQFSVPALTTIGFDQQHSSDLLIENILAVVRGEPVKEVPLMPPTVVIRGTA